jgi:HK97 family phage portal protein
VVNILRRLFGRETRANDGVVSADWLTGKTSMTSISALEAMNIPAVSAAVGFICGIVSTVPIRLYKRIGDDIAEIKCDQRAKLLNDETGDLLDSVQMKEAIVRDYLLKGGGYAYLNKRRNEIKSIHYVKNSVVSAVVSPDPVFKQADFLINGTKYFDFEIMRLLRRTDDGARGVGILSENAIVLRTMYNSLKYENITSGSGARKGFLKSAARLEADALRDLKNAWKKLTSNDSNDAMVLNQGITFEPAASTAVENQMNENKKTNSDLIFNVFGLSPEIYSKDDVFLQGLKTGVMPIITAFTKTINRFMLLESEKDSYFFSFDLTELMKAATLQRYQAYEIAIKNGWLTLDEVRATENLEALNLDFIKLGLDSVIYYYKDKKIYIPNTKEFVDVKGGGKNEN